MPNFEPLRTWSIPPGNYSNSTCEELECWKSRAQPSIEHWDADTDFIKNYCKSTDRFEKMWMTWLRPPSRMLLATPHSDRYARASEVASRLGFVVAMGSQG